MERINNDHSPQINCLCEMCKQLRKTKKCPHPHKCLSLATSLIAKIHTRWNPTIGPHMTLMWTLRGQLVKDPTRMKGSHSTKAMEQWT